MSRKFNVGDRVRIVSSQRWPSLVGREGTVIAGPVTHCTITGRRYGSGQHAVYELDISYPEPGKYANTNLGVLPEHIVLIYDGHEPVAWSSCVWQPNQVRA